MSKRNRDEVDPSNASDEVLETPIKKQKIEQNQNLEGSRPSVFAIKEMVENIIKYLLLEPMTILNIATVSRMHYELIFTTPLWRRFGFTKRLSEDDVISPDILRILLAKSKVDDLYLKVRYGQNVNFDDIIFWRNQSNAPFQKESLVASDLELDLNEDEKKELRYSSAEFIVNRTLTHEACKAILSTIVSGLSYPITLRELIEFIDLSKEDCNTVTPAQFHRRSFLNDYMDFEEKDVTLTVYFYENIKQSFDGFHRLFRVADCKRGSESLFYKFEIWKRFLDHNKELILINSRDETECTTEFFIKCDKSQNLVEKCGDLRTLIKLEFDRPSVFITDEGIDKAMGYLLNLENQSQKEAGWGRKLLESIDFDLFHQDNHYLGNMEYFPESVAGPVNYKKNCRSSILK